MWSCATTGEGTRVVIVYETNGGRGYDGRHKRGAVRSGGASEGQITFVFCRHIHARAACGESDACPCGAEYRGCGTRKTG